ncbi:MULTISPECIES: GIN domain-containing protein [Rhodocyclales]|uniref:DUF2807 domain-containing protein n=1 Tax=Azonexus hydrophilus TaxID=418702 RepID=A0ABZ2XM14_9RHOO|nr:DUF2807 domain-containing protein [Azospira sp. I09]BBN90574.1 hypothetical protein AZSP09_35970 [Azospira sp. I09]
MFGAGRKTAELEQRINDYHAALQRIAQHVGVARHQLPPDRLATAICDGIDALVGKEPPKASAPGSESRSITANIRKIRLSGAVDIVVRQGSEPKMEVFSNDANDLPKILTTVSCDCLTVDNEPMMIINNGGRVTQIISGNGNTQIAGRDYFEGGSIHIGRNFGKVIGNGGSMEQRTGPLGFRVEVTLPNVASLRISGAGNVTYRDIDQDELSLDVSGAGTIEVTGKVNRLEADVSGAGDIAAYLLSATHGRLRVSGAGNIKATATESVVARVSGVGKIKIAGNPPQRDTDVSGMGKIKFVDGNF